MMMIILISIIAFIVAVSLLVAFHEFGHYWTARRLGVKVLRFSIGFGKPLYTRVAGRDRTEYVVAAIPLGGYVKMLDEREGEVAAEEAPRAFNRQPVSKRFAIVAAGPAFNIILAVAAYWLMFMFGVTGMKPVIGEIAPESVAAEAGLSGGDRIVAVAGEPTPTWQEASMTLLQQAIEGERITVTVDRGAGSVRQQHVLELGGLRVLQGEGQLLDKLGIAPWQPEFKPVIGGVVEGGAAQASGLRPDDRIVNARGEPMTDWEEWVEFVQARPNQTVEVTIERAGERLSLPLTIEAEVVEGETVGRIGAYPQVDREALEAMRTTVRHDPVSAFAQALAETKDVSMLTLRVLWELVTGGASLKNISGPITIAEFAGVSAALGLAAFLGMLALFSISIGILNLLPIPVLDGGHLLFYLIEIIKGSPVSEQVEAVGQRVGLAMLVGLMMLAFYNDIARLTG